MVICIAQTSGTVEDGFRLQDTFVANVRTDSRHEDEPLIKII